MRRLPFGDGLTFARLAPLVRQAGFRDVRALSHGPIARAQRRGSGLRNRLRTHLYTRFILIGANRTMRADITPSSGRHRPRSRRTRGPARAVNPR